MHGIPPTSNPDNGTPETLALTVPEVAEDMRVTERYVWMLIKRGELPSFKIGNGRRVRRQDLKAYLNGLVEEERQLRERIAAGA